MSFYATYSDAYGEWNDVVVEVTLRIHTRNYVAPVNVKTDKLILRDGSRCDRIEGQCIDNDGFSTYWDTKQHNSYSLQRTRRDSSFTEKYFNSTSLTVDESSSLRNSVNVPQMGKIQNNPCTPVHFVTALAVGQWRRRRHPLHTWLGHKKIRRTENKHAVTGITCRTASTQLNLPLGNYFKQYKSVNTAKYKIMVD